MKANILLPELELVMYTFGNVSCVDRSRGVMAIKPSGVEYYKLTADDMVVAELASGRQVAGTKYSFGTLPEISCRGRHCSHALHIRYGMGDFL